ncbi:MAG: phosphoenolpyruvate carboxykinase (ATP) [Deltaproteobacteria bacterium]|nr:phosphoenolpyruvate carboxykinase (ATP) [Deltaproteobacteria bacterium]
MAENNQKKPDIETLGLKHLRRIRRNLTTPMLYEEIVKNREGQVAHLGAIAVRTGHDAEMPAEDRFIVKDAVSAEKVFWSDEKNELSENYFNTIFSRLLAYMHNKDAYVQDCLVGSTPEFQISIRVVTETAWHSLFARNMFYQIKEDHLLDTFTPAFTVVHVPGFHSIPELDGTNSASFVIISLAEKMILIGGSGYAGEIRQAVFTMTNHTMPESVFCMRCSANVGDDGDVAIFLGREDTGKTTLAVDPTRRLLGDHSHGWTDEGIFNLEWGGYAKILDIQKEKQPLVYDCTRKFGTLLENISISQDTRKVDFTDRSLSENTRAAYPITHIPNAIREGMFAHPKNLFLLTCDAFGVLPPIARLTPEQAVYAFLSAYTSKFTQMESGEVEPQVMFNVCFGDTALAHPAFFYGKKLMEKIVGNNINCWLINTGWSGEPCTRADRIPIETTRALVRSAVSGALADVPYEMDPLFQFEIPTHCPDEAVSDAILNPREAAADMGEYEMRANRLVAEFMKDFEKFEENVPEEMRKTLSQVISVDDTFDVDNLGFNI